MSYTEERLWSLLRQAEELPFGGNRAALIEQVLAEADAAGYRQLAFHARLAGTNGYVYGGEPAKSFGTFTWCLAEFDRDPVAHEGSRLALLWQFKSTVGALLAFPDTPLSRIDEVLADMARRWQAGGHSPHAVHSLRHLVAAHVGDETAAEYWYDRWLASARDDLSDCVACDPGRQVRWLSRRGRHEEAAPGARPRLGGPATRPRQPQRLPTPPPGRHRRTGAPTRPRAAHPRA